jgi:hypothetical protein
MNLREFIEKTNYTPTVDASRSKLAVFGFLYDLSNTNSIAWLNVYDASIEDNTGFLYCRYGNIESIVFKLDANTEHDMLYIKSLIKENK